MNSILLLKIRHKKVITKRLFGIAVLMVVASGVSMAQNAISTKTCVLEMTKSREKQAENQEYLLRLDLRYTLTSAELASLKVAVDSKEAGNFQTVAEERLRRGRGIALAFEIPITDWRTEKLSVFLIMQKKNPKPDEVPLATTTKVIERSSVKKE